MSFQLYKNPAKRTTQSKMLGGAIYNLGRYKKNKLRVLCLPGESCWDVAYFSGFKQIEKIVGLENNDDTFLKIKNKTKNFLKFKAINTTTTEYLERVDKHSFDIIYLDYFATFHSLVKIDLRLILKRRILKPGGRLLIAFLGAREPGHGTIENRLLYTDFCDLVNEQKIHLGSEDMLRCCSFNAYLFNLKYQYQLKISRPSWMRYRSGTAYMYMVSTGYNGEGRRHKTISRKLWFRTGEYKTIKEVTVKTTVPTAGLRKFSKDERRNHYKALIIDFYKKNEYTPYKKDIAKENIKGLTGLVREVGLCPRQYSTKDEVKAEVLRIYKKHNRLSYTLLNKAKIWGRLRHFGYAQTIRECGLEVGRMGGVYLNKKRIVQFRVLSNYLAHLDSGLHRTKFQHYSWIRHRNLTTRLKALKKQKDEMRWLSQLNGKETVYKDVITTDLNLLFKEGKGTLRFKPMSCTTAAV